MIVFDHFLGHSAAAVSHISSYDLSIYSTILQMYLNTLLLLSLVDVYRWDSLTDTRSILSRFTNAIRLHMLYLNLHFETTTKHWLHIICSTNSKQISSRTNILMKHTQELRLTSSRKPFVYTFSII